jgi:hypothetical protein
MKNKKFIIKMMIMILSFCAGDFIEAKVRSMMTRRDFENNVSNNKMVVALFYETGKDNKAMRDRNKGLTQMYADVSNYQPYDDADLLFVKVNIKRPDLAELAQLYHIKQVPTLIFFDNGSQLVNQENIPFELNGFVSRMDLQTFIDTHYGKEIKQYVADKDARREALFKEENDAWKFYFYPRYMVSPNYDPIERRKNME